MDTEARIAGAGCCAGALRKVGQPKSIPDLGDNGKRTVDGVGRWRLVDLQASVREAFNISGSETSISRELNAFGFRKLFWEYFLRGLDRAGSFL